MRNTQTHRTYIMEKNFSVAGVSTLKGSVKVRFAKDMARTKVLAANGHKDIRLVQLPKAMTKAEALSFLAADAKFQDAAAQAAIKGAKAEGKAPAKTKSVTVDVAAIKAKNLQTIKEVAAKQTVEG